jgi:hypothetical protein
MYKCISIVKNKMFSHSNIHKFTWTSPDGKTHNQTDRWETTLMSDHSGHQICDNDHYLVVANLGRDWQ